MEDVQFWGPCVEIFTRYKDFYFVTTFAGLSKDSFLVWKFNSYILFFFSEVSFELSLFPYGLS